VHDNRDRDIAIECPICEIRLGRDAGCSQTLANLHEAGCNTTAALFWFIEASLAGVSDVLTVRLHSAQSSSDAKPRSPEWMPPNSMFQFPLARTRFACAKPKQLALMFVDGGKFR